MRTIAIINLKGGVGKTVTSINMADILAVDHQQRVLLVDADSQCNTTEFFGGDPDQGSLADILRDSDGAYGKSKIQHTRHSDHLDLLPASEELMDLDLSKVEARTVRSSALMELRVALEIDSRYDYCVIDCPPAFSAASAAALLMADEVIIPIKLDAFSLRGMANLVRQVSNMRRINANLRVAGCLATMWYSSPTTEDALATLRASGLPVFGVRIRRTDKVDGMTYAQEPLSLYSPRSAAGVDYRRFVREYLEGARGNG